MACIVGLNLTTTNTTRKARKVVIAKRVSEKKYTKLKVRKMLCILPEILTEAATRGVV